MRQGHWKQGTAEERERGLSIRAARESASQNVCATFEGQSGAGWLEWKGAWRCSGRKAGGQVVGSF